MLSCLRRCVRASAVLFALVALLAAGSALPAQSTAGFEPVQVSLSIAPEGAGEAGVGGGQAEPTSRLEPTRSAVEAVVGLNGIGVYVAKPFNRHVSVRLGGNFTTYSDSFVEEGATVNGSLRFGYGKVSLDYYPNGGNGRFHVSPLLVFANNTRVHATVLIDPSETLDFSGDSYSSSAADPLRGTGQVDFRKTAPGVAIGYGNLTQGRGHWAFPVEAGFYYVGQPRLTVDFRGTACDVSHPANGCGDVTQDPGFQRDLARFIARNNHNLSYAQFVPMLNFGVGYRF